MPRSTWRVSRAAEQLAAIVESSDVAAIAAGRAKTAYALARAVHLQDPSITNALRRLLGVDANADPLNMVLHMGKENWASASAQGTTTGPSFGADDVPRDPLAQAVKIASDARDASVEIDWTENPKDDREAALRLATIRVIEQEQARIWGNPFLTGNSHIAYCTFRKLEDLAPEDAEFIGEDLWDAKERWLLAEIEERKQNELNDARSLREKAKRQMNE